MKYLKYVLLLISILQMGFNVQAQHVGTINDFEVLPQYLTSDSRIIISNTSETIIKYKVSFVRQYANSGPVGSYSPFNMSVQLSTNASNNNILLLGTASKITGANFPTNEAMLLDKEFTATIDNSKLNIGGNIILAYTTNDNSNPINSYNSRSYKFLLPPTNPPTNPPVTPIVTADSVPIYRKLWNLGGDALRLDPSSNEAGLQTRDIAFYAYNVQVTGSTRIDERMYTGQNQKRYYLYPTIIQREVFNPNQESYSSTGYAFYAFVTQVSGTSPIYLYVKNSDGTSFYSSGTLDESRFTSKGVAFYAFKVPDIEVPPPGRTRN